VELEAPELDVELVPPELEVEPLEPPLEVELAPPELDPLPPPELEPLPPPELEVDALPSSPPSLPLPMTRVLPPHAASAVRRASGPRSRDEREALEVSLDMPPIGRPPAIL
jgi:hypothetical protein